MVRCVFLVSFDASLFVDGGRRWAQCQQLGALESLMFSVIDVLWKGELVEKFGFVDLHFAPDVAGVFVQDCIDRGYIAPFVESLRGDEIIPVCVGYESEGSVLYFLEFGYCRSGQSV